LLFAVCCYGPATADSGVFSLDPIKKSDRILILAPHPDDEIIGCAGVIQRALSQGAQVKIVYLTNGEHNQFAFMVYEKRPILLKGEFISLGKLRRSESVKSAELLGLSRQNLIFLGYPDFGTFAIFTQYWQSKVPFESMLTRISRVPYKDSFRFDAAYVPENILSDLKQILFSYKPNKIFVSHPADVNVDHKSLYLYLEVALADLRNLLPRPKLYPYLIHCVGWPMPRNYHPELSLMPPEKFTDSSINWQGLELAPAQLENKHQAILCHRSQTQSSAFYLLSFARKREIFGDFPDIELEKQASAKEKTAQFFGFSRMYVDAGVEIDQELVHLIQDKGQVSYAIWDNALLIHLEKEKNLNRRFTAVLYLFGYSYKLPFARMPKIRINTKYDKFQIFDGHKLIQAQGVELELNPRSLILKIPLEVLGNPDFILTAAKVYHGKLPADAVTFRKIVINKR